MNQDIKELLDKHNEAFDAFRIAEDQLDYALESNRSITRALREARRARNKLLQSMMDANNAALKILSDETE